MRIKQAVILVEDLYEDMEFWYPYYRLQEEGYQVTVAAPEKGVTYTSKHGYPVVDGNIVSSRTPDDLPEFVVGLIKNVL